MSEIQRHGTSKRWADVVVHRGVADWVEVAEDTSLDTRDAGHDPERPDAPPAGARLHRGRERRRDSQRTLGRVGSSRPSSCPGHGAGRPRECLQGRVGGDGGGSGGVSPGLTSSIPSATTVFGPSTPHPGPTSEHVFQWAPGGLPAMASRNRKGLGRARSKNGPGACGGDSASFSGSCCPAGLVEASRCRASPCGCSKTVDASANTIAG